MNHSFKPMKARFRATFAAGGVMEPRLGKIDKENEVLHDVQITLEGEALGHGVWLDRQFCEDVAAAGNASGNAGVKVRFGHPAMCSDALGTYLGRAKNFRVVDLTRKDGTAAAGVVADIELAQEAHSAPAGDLVKWVMETAENSPDTFGQSIVFTYADLKVKDADGAEFLRSAFDDADSWMKNSADEKVYVVLGKLHGTDFTDTPAATDGVFSAGDLASEAEAMLDEHPQIADVVAKNPDSVFQFLTRLGVLDKIESKRVSNLQAEKDREIASLKAIVAERDELLKKTVADSEAALKKQGAEFVDVQGELTLARKELLESKAALEASEKAREQLNADVEAGAKALVDSRKQLERLQEKHAAIIGGALNAVHPEREFDYSAALANARTPEERLAAARRQIKNKH